MSKNRLLPNLEDTDAENEWTGMPEFVQEDKQPFRSIIMHFKNEDDVEAFAKLLDQNITPKTRSLYHPKLQIETFMDKRYIDKK